VYRLAGWALRDTQAGFTVLSPLGSGVGGRFQESTRRIHRLYEWRMPSPWPCDAPCRGLPQRSSCQSVRGARSTRLGLEALHHRAPLDPQRQRDPCCLRSGSPRPQRWPTPERCRRPAPAPPPAQQASDLFDFVFQQAECLGRAPHDDSALCLRGASPQAGRAGSAASQSTPATRTGRGATSTSRKRGRFSPPTEGIGLQSSAADSWITTFEGTPQGQPRPALSAESHLSASVDPGSSLGRQ
jgi:hypothetical protein